MTANYRAATIKPSVKPSHRGYWMEHLIAISAALHQPYLHIFGDDKDGPDIFAANTIKLHKIMMAEFSHNLEEKRILNTTDNLFGSERSPRNANVCVCGTLIML